jgi:GNAT superfamily N-acetyltransferase
MRFLGRRSGQTDFRSAPVVSLPPQNDAVIDELRWHFARQDTGERDCAKLPAAWLERNDRHTFARRHAANWTTEAAYIDGDRTTPALRAEEVAALPDACLLIARSDDGTIIATVWLGPAGADLWYLGSLTIAPTLQNAGAGRRLLEAAEQHARVRGARRIRMKVVNVRDTLIAWYLWRGYA